MHLTPNVRVCACVIATATFLLSGPLPLHAQNQPLSALPLSQRDFGASILALVDNARFAISRHDAVAAQNDMRQAQVFARQLPDRPTGQSLIAKSPITDFGLAVKLESAQADLGTLNFAKADADLKALQKGIPRSAIPKDLSLLSAAASLDYAHNAVATGRTTELLTQLLNAQRALDRYAASTHSEAARELSARVQRLATHISPPPDGLANQLSEWADQVCRWAGSERWGASYP